MPIRGSSNGARHTRPQARRGGRDRPERVVVINRNDWSSSIGTGGRHHPVRAVQTLNNSVLLQFTVFSCFFFTLWIIPAVAIGIYGLYHQEFRVKQMSARQRQRILSDAKYIREHHPFDALIADAPQ